jgi:hypothetical protein
MEGEDVAAWAAINNTFTRPFDVGGEGGWYWTGVLFQLGDFTYQGDMQGTAKKRVQFYKGNVKLDYELTSEDFKGDKPVWVNAQPRAIPIEHPPMDLTHFYKAFPASDEPWKLHHYLDPFKGGILCWENRAHGFILETSPLKIVNRRYSFWFQGGAFEVRVNQGGTWVENDDLKAVDHIVLRVDDDSPPGQNMNPPQGTEGGGD